MRAFECNFDLYLLICTLIYRSVFIYGCVRLNTIGRHVRLFVQECEYTSSQECVYVHIFNVFFVMSVQETGNYNVFFVIGVQENKIICMF